MVELFLLKIYREYIFPCVCQSAVRCSLLVNCINKYNEHHTIVACSVVQLKCIIA